jgi:hypothetical protein
VLAQQTEHAWLRHQQHLEHTRLRCISQLISSLAHHRHTRREHSSQDIRAIRRPAPQQPFSPAAASLPAGSPRTCPAWDRILVTTFRSPGPAAPFDASLPGSTFPACNFGSPTCDSPARSALWLRYPGRFAPTWAASLPRARFRFFACRYQPTRTLTLPFGTFISLGITARHSSSR